MQNFVFYGHIFYFPGSYIILMRIPKKSNRILLYQLVQNLPLSYLTGGYTYQLSNKGHKRSKYGADVSFKCRQNFL